MFASAARSALFLSGAITLINVVFGYVLLEPSIGFDDANITMVYAENIAAGHGYVYNIGSERVEGSTSPLWTAINVLAALLPTELETGLALLGVLIVTATLWTSMQLGRVLFEAADLDGRAAYMPVAIGFLAMPTYFGWAIWSLMDIGLWILLTTAAAWLLARLVAGCRDRPTATGLIVTGALMAITRPEGVAVGIAFSLLALGFGLVMKDRYLRGVALKLALAVVACWALLAAARYAYFGDIFPNTYYSKVSTNFTATLWQGLGYLKGFLEVPFNAGLLVLVALLPAVIAGSGRPLGPMVRIWLMAGLITGGGFALYVLIGGDHFGSFRFFLFAYPILFPFAALFLLLAWQSLGAGEGHWSTLVPVAAALLLVAVNWSFYAVNKGDYVREFRIAEDGRRKGELLNGYPGQPSIGVIAAGGVALAYEGHVYDLLGLNWVEMARTNREKVANYINHGGFSRGVFYATLPEIVHPYFGECDKTRYDEHPFYARILDHVFTEPEFQAAYEFKCWEGLVFYHRTGVGGVGAALVQGADGPDDGE